MKTLSTDSVRDIIPFLQQQRVLVLGDLMLDEFIWGKVHRISPEAPVPVVQVTHESASLRPAIWLEMLIFYILNGVQHDVFVATTAL